MQDLNREIDLALTIDYAFPKLLGSITESGLFFYRARFDVLGLAYHAARISLGGETVLDIQTLRGENPSSFENHELGPARIQIMRQFNVAQPFLANQMSAANVRPLDFQARLNEISNLVVTWLQTVTLLSPLRGIGRPGYGIGNGLPTADMLAANLPEEQAAAIVNAVAAYPELAEQVALEFQTILGREGLRGLRSRLRERAALSAESVEDGLSVNLVNEAFGMNQLVGPLLSLAQATPGSLVAIEEPEIHLHPKAQAQLSMLFAQMAQQHTHQLMLTTHSEHIVMAFLTAVATGMLDVANLAVYEFKRLNGRGQVERLQVNESGQIAGGLAGFLEADLASMGEMLSTRFTS
jgi:hypothetical protein